MRLIPAVLRPASGPPSAVRNVVSNWGVAFFSLVTAFFLAPFVVHQLGNESYGAWVLLTSLVGYLGLLDLGVRGGVTRFVAKLHAAADHEEAGRFASTALFLFSLSATAAVAVVAGLALTLDRLFEIPPELVPDARIAIVLSGLSLALALLNGVFGGIVIARERFDLSNATDVAIEAARVGAIVAALGSGGGIVALAAVQLGGGVARLLAYSVMSRRVYPELRLSRGTWDREHLRQILAYSLTSAALQGAGLISTQLNALVIGAFLSVSLVAFYAIASNLATQALVLVAGIAYTVPPRVSALEGAGAIGDVRRIPLLSGRVASLVFLPVVVTFLLRGGTFIRLWMGPEYEQLSGQVLVILSLGLWFVAGRTIMTVTLMGLNRHRVLIPAFVLEAAAIVALTVWWVKSYGVLGVAWGGTVPALLMTTAGLPFIFRRALEIPIRRIWLELWILPSLAVIPFALGSWTIERMWTPDSLALFFAQVALILPLAAAGGWWVGLRETERAAVAAQLPRSRRPVVATG